MTEAVDFRDHLKHLFSVRVKEGPRLDLGIDTAWLAYVARAWPQALRTRPLQDGARVNDTLRFLSSEEQKGSGGTQTIEILDPISQVRVKHTVDARLVSLIDRLRTGCVSAASLPEVEQQKLLAAGVLVDASTVPMDLESSSLHLMSHGFARIQRAVGPLQVVAMQRYIAALIESKVVSMGDGQVSNRYTYHNDPHLQDLHDALATLVSRLAGKPMKASYRYLSAYTTGSELALHVDRVQCEVTLSVLVDYSPDAGGVAGWPIFLKRDSGTVGIFQEIGEALVFRGQDIPHYRERIQAGHRCTVVLLHYVDASFSGALD